MASDTDSSTTVDEEVRRLYERYQSAESDEERREIALEMENSTDVVTQTSTRRSRPSQSPTTELMGFRLAIM